MGPGNDIDEVIERYHGALGAFMRGDHEPARRLYSERDDVTLGNPFGPFVRGSAQVVEAMARAADNYRDGDASAFDPVSKHVAADLAYSWRSSGSAPMSAAGRISCQVIRHPMMCQSFLFRFRG